MSPEVLRLAAFPAEGSPDGGNPAGVVLDARGLSADAMLGLAAEVGYSETAFLVPAGGSAYDVRYFAPAQEVPFCGHATVAAGVALGPGDWTFRTPAGDVEVDVRAEDGRTEATLVSRPADVAALGADDLAELLAALDWSADDLDPDLPPRVAYAGAHHPVLAAATRERLARLDYDFDRLRARMLARDWTTVALVWREAPTRFHARDPFPVGGVVEDPATGAAAAALGGYLRALRQVDDDAEITVLQGEDLGRPSRLRVRLVAGDPRIRVSGTAVPIPAGS